MSGLLSRRAALAGAAGAAWVSLARGSEALSEANQPLPCGARIGMVGDSINEYEFTAGPSLAIRREGSTMVIPGVGELNCALAIDPRASFLAWNDTSDTAGLASNIGRYYSGGDVARAAAGLKDILAQVPRLASYRPDVVIIGGGTNSLSLPDAEFRRIHLAIIDAVHAALPNAPIGVETIRPVAPRQAALRPPGKIAAKNSLIAENVAARARFARLIDLSAYADDKAALSQSLPINFASAPYQPHSGGDDLHPGPLGAQTKGAPALLSFIRAVVAPGNAISKRKSSTVLPESMAQNLGNTPIEHGDLLGGAVSGFAPARLDVAPASLLMRSTCQCSLERNSETGGQTLVMRIDPKGDATDESFVIRPRGIALDNPVQQDCWLRMWAKIRVNQGAGWLRIVLVNTTLGRARKSHQEAVLGIYPDGAGDRILYPVTPHKHFSASDRLAPSIAMHFNPSRGAGPYVFKLEYWDVQQELPPYGHA